MNEVLIDYETAKLAKQKGFNEAVQSFIYEDGIHWSPVHLIDDLLYVYKIEKRHKSNKSITTLDSSDTLNFYLCPTQSLLQKWIREKHNINIEIYTNACGYNWQLNKAYKDQCCTCGTYILESNSNELTEGPNEGGSWDIYEEALEGALLEALKLIK